MGRFASVTYYLKALGIFIKKPMGEKWMLLSILVLSFLIRMMVLLLPFKYLSKFLGSQGKTESIDKIKVQDSEIANTVSRQIKNISNLVPWDSNCLVQATTGKIILRRRRIDSTVYFGVKKENSGLLAHAWLNVEGKTILGGEIANQYTEVSSFS